MGTGVPPARLFFVALLLALSAVPLSDEAGAQAPGRPNILIILTDDQRGTDTMQAMTDTLNRFAQGGVSFPNGYAATPVCCPARAAIMTGRFAHNNGVRTNGDKDNLVQESTVQKYLGDAGYRTAIVGKYLNGWDIAQDPPFFDRWSIMQPGYYNRNWNIEGSVQNVPTYSTDFVAEKALDYLQAFESDDADPWFLYLAPYAPHAPLVVEPDYENADVGSWAGNPGVFETDETDKPLYVRNSSETLADAQARRQGQLRMLLSVDDMVETVFQELEARGEENTLAFFLSDNGFMWSEHGLTAKNKPYTESIHIPFLARWPGHLAPGSVDPRLVANIDVAPTIMDAAGIASSPQYPMDGVSLLQPISRTKMLTEGWAGGNIGTWASIRTPRYQYIEYYADDGLTVTFRELYSLAKDPWQLENVLGDATTRNDSDVAGLAAELAASRTCSGGSCLSALTSTVALCAGRETRLADHLVGTEGADRLVGGAGAHLACGFGGNDRVRTGPGRDVLLGSGGRDVLRGGKGRDELVGGGGKDQLKGQAGRDRLRGGPGKDRCTGGPGHDRGSSCETKSSIP
ncbi:MAG: sulfatase-like hydrolase/transferase [Actinomycetota bacterium]